MLITQAVRREGLRSVRALLNRIYAFIGVWNEDAMPFRWNETSEQILAKAIRQAILGHDAGRSPSRLARQPG